MCGLGVEDLWRGSDRRKAGHSRQGLESWKAVTQVNLFLNSL
jgi:hypothetical protein